MMPFIMGDPATIPGYLHGYLPMIDKCSSIERGKVAYLTVHESLVKSGDSQRRGGIHTESYDSTKQGGWGGGWGKGSLHSGWGGGWGKGQKEGCAIRDGIYMASTDGSCRIWDCSAGKVDKHGALMTSPSGLSEKMRPNYLYWMTDRTPHEALRVSKDTRRQFFRLVSNKIGGWFKQHNTPNPFGVLPDCPIIEGSKF